MCEQHAVTPAMASDLAGFFMVVQMDTLAKRLPAFAGGLFQGVTP
jgi:hypothetical protein